MQKDLIRQIEHSSVLKVLKQGVRSVGGSMKGLRLRTPEKILGQQNPGLSYELLLAEPSTEANLVNQ